MMSEETETNSKLNGMIPHETLKTASLGTTTSIGREQRQPKRILHFSDGILEEYSSEDENHENASRTGEQDQIAALDPKTLDWMPWFWYLTTSVGSKTLEVCDYLGESLANFFGITSPKYQFEINEYLRQQAEEREIQRNEDLEMGGWIEQKQTVPVSRNPEADKISQTGAIVGSEEMQPLTVQRAKRVRLNKMY